MADGRIVGLESFCRGNRPAAVIAVNAVNGAVVWRSRSAFEIESNAGPGAGQHVIVLSGPHNSLSGRDVATGRVLWRRADREPMADGPTVAVVDRVTKAAVHIFVLDRRTGRQLWQRSVPTRRSFPTVTAGGGVVAVTGSISTTGYDARSGMRRWTIPIVPASDTFGLRFEDGVVSGVTGTGANAIRAYAASTGRPLWSNRAYPVQEPEPTDHNFYADVYTHANDHFIALDARTGSVRWRRVYDGSAFAGGVRVVLSSEGKLTGVNARTGSIVWRASAERLDTIAGQPLGSPGSLETMRPTQHRVFLSFGNCLGE